MWNRVRRYQTRGYHNSIRPVILIRSRRRYVVGGAGEPHNNPKRERQRPNVMNDNVKYISESEYDRACVLIEQRRNLKRRAAIAMRKGKTLNDKLTIMSRFKSKIDAITSELDAMPTERTQ